MMYCFLPQMNAFQALTKGSCPLTKDPQALMKGTAPLMRGLGPLTNGPKALTDAVYVLSSPPCHVNPDILSNNATRL